MLELLNDPSWIRYIGDRGVRTLAGAAEYIERGPVAMYTTYGFGLYLIERKVDGEPIGICGLVKRDFLEDVDIGFAMLERYRGNGYALEAARAVMEYAEATLGLKRVVAITTRDNERSARLLEKLGLRFEGMVRYPGESDMVRLFTYDAVRRSDAGVSTTAPSNP
jgi:ribosomal-protein-alanine N-acetyltransferase